MNGILEHKYTDATDDLAAYLADRCNRQAVTVEFAYEHLVDETIYVFSQKAYDVGLDPWILIDAGIDKNLRDGGYVLCYGRTGEMLREGSFRVFASKKSLERVRTTTSN